MERILKRAATASRTVKRKVDKQVKHVENSKEAAIRLSKQRTRKAVTQLILDERKRRKEQWELGALAPRHDTGDKKLTFGTMPVEVLMAPDEFKKRRPTWYPIAAGDRVAVISGRYKDRVAEVTSLNEESCHVQLKGLDVNAMVPAHMKDLAGGRDIITRALDIPFKNVRLVFPLPDPESGIPRDVMIEGLERLERGREELQDGSPRAHRVIAGTNTIIPWPATTEEVHTTHPDDTTIDLVELETVMPNLLTAPMPTTLIDEIRNKQSKFRTRFSYEVEQRMRRKEERDEQRKALINTMRTPLQELALLRAQQRQATQRDLTTTQLAKIGEIMRLEQLKARKTAKEAKTAALDPL